MAPEEISPNARPRRAPCSARTCSCRHTAGRTARTARHHISNEAAPQTDVSASDSPMLLLVGLRRSFVSNSDKHAVWQRTHEHTFLLFFLSASHVPRRASHYRV